MIRLETICLFYIKKPGLNLCHTSMLWKALKKTVCFK